MVMIGQMQQRRCVGTGVGVIILASKVSYSELVVASHKPAVCLHDGGVLPPEIAMCQQASRHLSLSFIIALPTRFRTESDQSKLLFF